MRKALNTGLISGIIFSLFFIGASYIRRILPEGSYNDKIFFLVTFFLVIAATFWIAMDRYSKTTGVRWRSLNLIGIIASFTGAIIFGSAAFLYTRFIHPEYLYELTLGSKEHWISRNYSANAIARISDWSWFSSPFDFAVYNFQDSLIVLILFTFLIASLYYIFNRKKYIQPFGANNHELIF